MSNTAFAVIVVPYELGQRRRDEAFEKRMRVEGAALEFRVELDADEPRVIRVFHRLGQQPIRQGGFGARAHTKAFPLTRRSRNAEREGRGLSRQGCARSTAR